MNSRKIIKEAAFHLFETHPFKDISVQDILNEAEMSRSTFYKFFRDKYELIYEYYCDKFEPFYLMHEKMPSAYSEEDWKESTISYLTEMKKYRHYYKNAGDDFNDSDSLWQFMLNCHSKMYVNIRKKNLGTDKLPQKDRLIIEGCMISCLYLFRKYLFAGDEITPEELTDIISEIIPLDYRTYREAPGPRPI